MGNSTTGTTERAQYPAPIRTNEHLSFKALQYSATRVYNQSRDITALTSHLHHLELMDS